MTDPIKQALEALYSCTSGDYSTGHVIHPSFDEAAVDAAIEALEGLEKAEPVRLASKRCSNALRINGEAYPRTCQVCGLGPCGLGSHPAPVQAEPSGWKLVPVEPTQEMTEIGAGVIDDNGGNARWSDVREAYAAMLNAAPQPAAQVVGLTDEQIIAVTDEIPVKGGFVFKIARAVIAEFCRVNGIKPPEKGGAV